MNDRKKIHGIRHTFLCFALSLLIAVGLCAPDCIVQAAADETKADITYDSNNLSDSREEVVVTGSDGQSDSSQEFIKDGSDDQSDSSREFVKAGSDDQSDSSRETAKDGSDDQSDRDQEIKKTGSDGKTSAEAKPDKVEEFSDYQKISKALSESEDGFASMTVDASSGRIVKDGEEGSLAREYDAGTKEVNNAISSTKKMENFLEKKDGERIYQVDKGANGDYEITAPYQTRRLIVKKLIKNDTMGAARVYYNTKDKETILEFNSDEDTKRAYEQAAADYGEDRCLVDQIFYCEDLVSSMGSASAGGNCVSWGTRYMGMNYLKAGAASYGYNKPIVIAVIDSGVNKNNPLFSGGRIIDDSWNFAKGNSDYSDTYGHGSHVAGIIADATPANVKLLILKVTNNKGQGSLYAMMNALRYALDHNVQIVNMSMGIVLNQYEHLSYLNGVLAKAWSMNIPVCCAAGNAGVNVRYVYPASLSKTITVAAINSNGKRGSFKAHGRKFYFSSYGKRIDFAAPGTNIISAGLGMNYKKMTGTSMATPHITAAIAYLKMKSPNMSVPQVKKRLKKVSKDLGSKGKDKYFGWGCPMMKKLVVKSKKK